MSAYSFLLLSRIGEWKWGKPKYEKAYVLRKRQGHGLPVTINCKIDLIWGKNEFNLLSTKIDLPSKKKRQILNHHSPLSRLHLTPSLQTYQPCSRGAQRTDMGKEVIYVLHWVHFGANWNLLVQARGSLNLSLQRLCLQACLAASMLTTAPNTIIGFDYMLYSILHYFTSFQ